MDNLEFDKIRKRVERKKIIYALMSKIEDYEFKIIEYGRAIDQIKIELEKAQKQLEDYNNMYDQ